MLYSDSMRSDVSCGGLAKIFLEVITGAVRIRVALKMVARWSNVMHSAFRFVYHRRCSRNLKQESTDE
jgi:hypothetical protein